MADALEPRVTAEGLMTQFGDVELTEKLTVPAKPLRLFSFIATVMLPPALVATALGTALTLKSLKVMGTIIVWVREPLVAVTMTW